MKERPILFSGPMVRAILDGRKTQTRRIVDWANIYRQTTCSKGKLAWSIAFKSWAVFDGDGDADLHLCKCPYGEIGDRLWVKETWRRVCSGEISGGEGSIRYGIQYRSDNFIQWQKNETKMSGGWKDTAIPMQFREVPWKPSIFNRKSDSRVTLEITNVRVERLHEISEADAKAEGIEILKPGFFKAYNCMEGFNTKAKRSYEQLWDSINGKKHPWSSNPWVWVIEFRKL